MMNVRPSWYTSLLAGVWVCLALIPLAGPPPCHAQGCPSQRAVDRLLDCEYCHHFKELINAAKWYNIDLKTYDITNGVIIELGSEGEDAAELIHRLANKLWLEEMDSPPRNHCCSHCENRWEHLLKAERSGALTETGAIITLTSRDEVLAKWLQSDARMHEQLLATIHESH